jgi:hypothetical protein
MAQPHALFIDETYRRCGVTCNTAIYVHVIEAALAFVSEKSMATHPGLLSQPSIATRMGSRAIPIETAFASGPMSMAGLRPRQKSIGCLIGALCDTAGARI